MTGRRLATTVHVHRDGATYIFGPGDPVPDWAAAELTDPIHWADVDEQDGSTR